MRKFIFFDVVFFFFFSCRSVFDTVLKIDNRNRLFVSAWDFVVDNFLSASRSK